MITFSPVRVFMITTSAWSRLSVPGGCTTSTSYPRQPPSPVRWTREIATRHATRRRFKRRMRRPSSARRLQSTTALLTNKNDPLLTRSAEGGGAQHGFALLREGRAGADRVGERPDGGGRHPRLVEAAEQVAIGRSDERDDRLERRIFASSLLAEAAQLAGQADRFVGRLTRADPAVAEARRAPQRGRREPADV